MKILGKSLKEYVAAVWMFFALALIIITTITVLRWNNADSPEMQNVATLMGVTVLIWAGVAAVKDHGFNLPQTAVVGLLLSLASAWTLPIFHPPLEALYVLLINGLLYALVAVAGGWLAQKVFKRT